MAGRWGRLLLRSLEQAPVVLVRAVVEEFLDRPASRSEQLASQRAARQLAEAGQAQVLHLPARVRYVGATGYLVLARPGLVVTEDELLRLGHRAAGGTDLKLDPAAEEDEMTLSENAVLASDLTRVLGEAAAGLRRVHAYQVPPQLASTLAASLAEVEVEVARLRRQLLRQAQTPQD